jgi:hypothetical protein
VRWLLLIRDLPGEEFTVLAPNLPSRPTGGEGYVVDIELSGYEIN